MALTKLKTSGIADDAVTTDKLANAINTERTANTAKTSTTINNNADNRVITGSGTANTLEGESGLTYNGSSVLTVSGSGQQDVLVGSTDAGGAAISLDGDSNGDGAGSDYSLIRHNTDGNLEITTRNPSGATATIFTQGTAESMRIDSSGKVGIGDTSPQAKLHIQGENTTNGTVFLEPDSNKGGNISHIHHGSAGNWYIRPADASGYIYHDIGKSQFTNGILFGSDTAAANTLDDYEEGTFTPDWNGSSAGTTTYSTNQGSYTKIGNIVHIRIYSGINGTTGTGGWEVKNLPFASPDSLNAITTGSCMTDDLNWENNYTCVVPYKNANSTLLHLYASKDNDGWDQVQISDDSSFAIILGITYKAA